jgi:hypothetical protein
LGLQDQGAIIITGKRIFSVPYFTWDIQELFRPVPGGHGDANDDRPIIITGTRLQRSPAKPPPPPPRPFSPVPLPAAAGPDQPEKNYCGAEGGRTFPSGSWNAACRGHDVCYAQQRNRLLCDAILGGEVSLQCLSGPPIGGAPFPINLFGCSIIGVIYGGAVIVGGSDAYRRSKDR